MYINKLTCIAAPLENDVINWSDNTRLKTPRLSIPIIIIIKPISKESDVSTSNGVGGGNSNESVDCRLVSNEVG